jgi:putative transposase
MAKQLDQRGYPSDVTDEEWAVIEPLIPPQCPGPGRPREVDMRAVWNGLQYLLRTGCQWEMIPHEYPHHSTIRYYYDLWRWDGTLVRISEALRQQVRTQEGRHAQPSAGIIDSQSAKTTEVGGDRGFDGNKKVNGRKRHILVDTLGLLLGVVVHAADIQDRDGARLLLRGIKQRFPDLKHIWADGGYSGDLIAWAQCELDIVIEIVKRNDKQCGFVVLPRRWVVERTFAWFGRNRQLSKDYEYSTRSSESMVYLASIQLMARRVIYPKSCTKEYCEKLTSSGKCKIIENGQRRQNGKAILGKVQTLKTRFVGKA